MLCAARVGVAQIPVPDERPSKGKFIGESHMQASQLFVDRLLVAPWFCMQDPSFPCPVCPVLAVLLRYTVYLTRCLLFCSLRSRFGAVPMSPVPLPFGKEAGPRCVKKLS